MTARSVPAVVVPTERAERDGTSREVKLPTLGAWYWVTSTNPKDEDPEAPQPNSWVGCVTHIGSNYARVTFPCGDRSIRIHLDKWEERTQPLVDSAGYFRRRVDEQQARAQVLMGKVRELAAGLSLPVEDAQIPESSSATQALATRGSNKELPKYKRALIKAKEKTLPALYKEIRQALDSSSYWMKAELVPAGAQLTKLRGIVKHIEGRVFNVTLYAGLTEEVKCITEGKPAPADTPIHVFQRRHYMDEECLVDYQAGGMKFQNLKQFDAWLAKPRNRDRILPHPRCIVAFRIRRFDKVYEFGSLAEFITFAYSGQKEADMSTYLYMRNGEQVYRLQTEIQFQEQLFPDDRQWDLMPGQAYATQDGSEVISEGQYEQMKLDEAERLKEWRWKRACSLWGLRGYKKEYPALKAAYAVAKAKYKADHERWIEAMQEFRGNKGIDHPDAPPMPEEPHEPDPPDRAWFFYGGGSIRGDEPPEAKSEEFKPWNRDNVHADDVSQAVKDRLDAHNRTVLVLQGLLDRSPIWNPHPRCHLWTEADFKRMLVLVYDDSRSLVAGPKPDFEAYRKRLEAKITAETFLIGQDRVWQEVEAERENARRENSRRGSRDWNLTTYKPYGNPGPGKIAQPSRIGRGQVTFRWEKSRLRTKYTYGGEADDTGVPCTLNAPLDRLFNVSDYSPGDFRQFFADPRTRAEYVQWAPFLLAAEDWHASKKRGHVDGKVHYEAADGDV